MIHQQRGYILFITFALLALCTSVVSVVMIKGLTHKKFTQALLNQAQMEQFTLSAVSLASSFLFYPAPEKKSDQKNTDQKSAAEPEQAVTDQNFDKKILEKMLPVVNKTQTFMMKEMEKNFPVVINLTFFCESGKININGLYDFVSKKFYDEGVEGKDKKVFATWLFDKIAAITQKPSLLQSFIEHCKQRKTPFNDVTQLLAIPEFATCFDHAVFYDQRYSKQNVDKKVGKLFLTDIFTVACENDTIQPWLLSSSVCALLDVAQKNNAEQKSGKKEDDTVDLSSFKQQAEWSKDWDLGLKQIYQLAYDKVPEQFRQILAPQFSVPVFSVMVSVTRELEENQNSTDVRIYAILKEKKLLDGSITYDVVKIYQV